MRRSHLSELEVQQFALRESDGNESIMNHIKQCEQCELRVQTYTTLFSAIAGQGKPGFDVSELVMSQISQPQTTNVFQEMLFYFICSLCIFILGLSFYLVENPLFNLFSNLDSFSIFCFGIVVCVLFSLLLSEKYKDFQQKIKQLKIN